MAKKIIAGCIAVAILSGLSYYSSYLYSARQAREENDFLKKNLEARDHRIFAPEPPKVQEEPPGEEVQERRETLTAPDAVHVSSGEYAFYLAEEFGYVIIYQSDMQSVYEYTTIPVSDLPQEIQEELRKGKGVPGERELYDFLENYSS